jgi:hypothetical protein
MKKTTTVAWLFGFASIACGSSDKSATTPDGTPGDGTTHEFSIPSECRGFAFENVRYSPGGDALPNTCVPFDPTTNNPFAVRCVDVLPGYATTYPGDEFCILPPPPDRGAQIGIHPQGDGYWDAMWKGDLSGYADRDVVEPFEVAPGGELEQVYYVRTGNDDAQQYYRVDSRMRTGSHHMATFRLPDLDGDQAGWGELVDAAYFPLNSQGFLWNSQRSNTDRPANSLSIPSEDIGTAMPVDVNQAVAIDVHHFNARDQMILRETWINLWWVEGDVLRAVSDVPIVAPVDIPPNTVKTLDAEYTPKKDVRLISLFGHRHAWTRSIDAWVERADGTTTPVYDSYNWEEAPTYSYDSLSTNPVADPDKQRDGAASGIVTIAAGDKLKTSCHVDTTAARASEIGVPVPTESLKFGNRAFDAEMCILYAQVTTP